MPEKRTLCDIDENGALAGLRATVIGRGPLGLMSALALAQNGVAVRVIADAPIKNGVGFRHAAGLIEPVATQDGRAARWSRETSSFCGWATPDPAWAVNPRSVLFLSDSREAIRQDWMMDLNWREAHEGELRGGRAYGSWFDTHVIQPDLAVDAIKRECSRLGVVGGVSDAVFGSSHPVPSVERAAEECLKHGSDFFVLAPGMGLATLADIEELVGVAAGLSAGMGLTIRIPNDRFERSPEYVLMDDDELGYFIPQRTQVVAGGTNEIVEHDDPVVGGAVHPALINEWEGEVREKMERLLPGAGDLEGEVRVGPRPMRGRVLTHWTKDFEVPGAIVGGAGGSGWTFSVGIAHDVCKKIARYFECEESPRALGTLTALDPWPDLDPVV